jgi:hypothetical protein
MASNTYEAVGNKADISEIITNISPSDTPLLNRIGKGKKGLNPIHQWLEDEDDGPRLNEQREGFTFFVEKGNPRIDLFNYMQIMERGAYVTGTQQATLHHGVKDEMAYQVAKKMRAIALDCEVALLNQDARILGSMPTARRFGGLPFWIATHVFENSVSPGAPRPLTFDLVNDALEATWIDGGKPSVLLVSPTTKRVVSTFTAGNVKNIEGGTKKLTQMITVLETDFGLIQTLTDRWMKSDAVYGLSPEYIKRSYLRPFRVEDIPKIADMEQKVVYGEWTLEMRAEKAHFVIKDLEGFPSATPS